jgi:hypothetical protein
VTLLLAHPEAEDLGRFVEGTLEDPERAAIVDHLADCDDCRILVVDAAEFVEPVVVHSERRWWMATAAAIAIAVIGGGIFFRHVQRNQRDPLEAMIEASANVRSVEARLSGFPHVTRRTMRGAVEPDSATLQLRAAAYDVLERRGDDPRMQHAKGIAQLIVARGKFAERSEQLADATTDEQKNAIEAARRDFVVEQNFAIALLQSAAVRVPNKASYQSDLAAALIETHEAANLDRAVKACDQALKIDPRSQDALFNRAIALRALSDPNKAIAAFKLYLTVDSSSPWAEEAKQNIETLSL